jgi:hypothetical protein
MSTSHGAKTWLCIRSCSADDYGLTCMKHSCVWMCSQRPAETCLCTPGLGPKYLDIRHGSGYHAIVQGTARKNVSLYVIPIIMGDVQDLRMVIDRIPEHSCVH